MKRRCKVSSMSRGEGIEERKWQFPSPNRTPLLAVPNSNKKIKWYSSLCDTAFFLSSCVPWSRKWGFILFLFRLLCWVLSLSSWKWTWMLSLELWFQDTEVTRACWSVTLYLIHILKALLTSQVLKHYVILIESLDSATRDRVCQVFALFKLLPYDRNVQVGFSHAHS